MPAPRSVHRAITCGIAGVWFINGLVCKVLGVVPRHERIVARILGGDHAALITTCIGVAEAGMAIWVITGIAPRTNAALQIALIAIMNLLEFLLAPDLLLWGHLNAAFAFAFILLIAWNARHVRPDPTASGTGRAS
ncbi:MAG: hypothetical protein H0X38_00530 [Planctomycetes bacterium]|nr:hypothetical protein [Planctomycetota bacterium]